jgi:hypothetical protein
MTKELFPEDPRESFAWQAYLSSALTLQDAQARERVKGLNSLIKKWLEEDAQTFIYLPQEYSDPSRSDSMTPEEIYILDRWRVAESDFVIMSLDTPSFGVGLEAEIACSMGIPIIAFHYKGHHVSRIIRGLPTLFTGEGTAAPSGGIVSYEDVQNYSDLKSELVATARKLQRSLKRVPTNVHSIQAFSERLGKAIAKSGKSISQIAIDAGFTEAFLHSLLNNYRLIEKIFEPYEFLAGCRLRNIPEERYSNPGLWVLRRLSETLNVRVSSLVGEEELNRIWHEPLVILSNKGVTLEEFVEVSDDADYLVMYQKAARKGSPEEVAEGIYNLVKRRRNGRPE